MKSQQGAHGMWQSLSVFYKEKQKAKKSQDIPEELQGVEFGLPGINTHNTKVIVKTLVIGVVWIWLRPDQWLQLEILQADSSINRNVI